MPTSEPQNTKDKPPLHNGKYLPTHIIETLIDFFRALRTGHNTTPEDAKTYADLEIEFNNRRSD